MLGIDNVIFILILADKLPESQLARAKRLGLALAMGFAVFVEFLNLRMRRRRDPAPAQPVELRRPYAREARQKTSNP